LSIALAGILLDRLAVGPNTMTLGGLAIAAGLLVEGARLRRDPLIDCGPDWSDPGASRSRSAIARAARCSS
jgi:hypothetical protein